MRSKLFVPGSRPELFRKALASAADGVCFDLEDAVLESRKGEAREAVHAFLRSGETIDCGKVVIVRINAMDTPHFQADMAAVALPGVDLVNLPKPGGVEQVREAAAALARAERENGVDSQIRLLLNIEAPSALRQAVELARADARVVGLQLGLGDLFEPLGIGRRERAAIEQAMFAVRIAAGEAGIYAYDSAFANIADSDGYLAEARLARRMGFLGKTCIHPSQVSLANEVFQPTGAEIEHARKVVEAADRTTETGMGAFVVDGHMVDAPFIDRARKILEFAHKLQLIEDDPL